MRFIKRWKSSTRHRTVSWTHIRSCHRTAVVVSLISRAHGNEFEGELVQLAYCLCAKVSKHRSDRSVREWCIWKVNGPLFDDHRGSSLDDVESALLVLNRRWFYSLERDVALLISNLDLARSLPRRTGMLLMFSMIESICDTPLRTHHVIVRCIGFLRRNGEWSQWDDTSSTSVVDSLFWKLVLFLRDICTGVLIDSVTRRIIKKANAHWEEMPQQVLQLTLYFRETLR